MLPLNFTPFPLLETERLMLRRLRMNDLPEMVALRQAVRKRSEEEVRQMLGKIDDDINSNRMIAWGLTLRGNDRLIGDISFWRILPEHHRAEIGYSLLPEFWRKGIMSEAMEAVLKYGFETMQLHSVEANIAPDNIASKSILEKFGFVREGYFRENYFDGEKFSDSAIYSLLNPRGK